jgi:hypothetical protein
MMQNLHEVLNVAFRAIITNPPAEAIGGTVFVMDHGRFWSVNHQSNGGDSGWQSERICRRTEADIAAEELASILDAEVVD